MWQSQIQPEKRTCKLCFTPRRPFVQRALQALFRSIPSHPLETQFKPCPLTCRKHSAVAPITELQQAVDASLTYFLSQLFQAQEQNAKRPATFVAGLSVHVGPVFSTPSQGRWAESQEALCITALLAAVSALDQQRFWLDQIPKSLCQC